jgi:hypothetical protein
MTALDLGQFLAEDIRVILEWIYIGEPPQVLAEKIFDIVLISNYLLIDALKRQCFNFLKAVTVETVKELTTTTIKGSFFQTIVCESTRDPEYPMKLYNLASLLGDRKLLGLARDGFLKAR